MTGPALPTGPEPPAPEPPTPLVDASGPPAEGWVRPRNGDELAWWVFDHHSSFTDEALERAAIAAGYSTEAYRSARDRVDARIASTERLKPIKSTAKRVIIVAYLAVWVSFGVAFFALPTFAFDFDFVLFPVLTAALAITLAMSLVSIRSNRPDPGRPTRALVLLLVAPLVLLLGIAGICLPTTWVPV